MPRRRFNPARRATPSIAISIRTPVDINEKRMRLEELLDLSTPELFALGVTTIETEIAESQETAA
jgi:hypothetical protein